ncbi:hypothetical protein NUW58_g4137 [Xylaria curta]|uniref:Uncharacterized protein n=1 Tax=Xylaria curta TaxID=42375 RepID=A0ACC1P864_9PEZI|nr:hypothetical protein NUW58_g4137 [Xylaria curta]
MRLKPPVSVAARRMMKSAFNDIEGTITPDDSSGFSTVTLEDVRKVALSIENQLAARQALRNMRRLMPLFQGMEHYSHAIEILCNGTPYLSWIWAPVSLILRIASEYVEAFEQVIRGYSRISESLGRFSTLSKALSEDMDFQQTLAVFYSDIMLFHKTAYQFVRRNGWKLLFLTSWGRFQRRFDNLLEDMKRHESLIDLQANASNIAEAREMRENINVWKEESLANIRQLNEKESTKQYESIITWLKADESDQLGILDTVSSESSRYPGTCSWALTNSKLKFWLQPSSDMPLLWLQGKPGSGKSVLASEITKFMKASNQSLLLQLLRNNDELVAHVYKDCVLGRTPPTVQALEKLVPSLLKVTSSEPRQRKYLWVVIDGLNECEKRQQANVMSFLSHLTGKMASGGDTIWQVIALSDERNSIRLAIMKYVSQRLQMLHDKLRQLELGQKEIEALARVITNKADGMFLYARLVLDYLANNIFYSGAEMQSSIDELPKELSEFYEKILTQVLIQLDSRSVERLKSIFGWIAFSKRPLKRMEFLSALTFASGDSTNKKLTPSYVLDVQRVNSIAYPATLTIEADEIPRFLQSSTSNFQITHKGSVIEHCVSTITCLLSGFDYLVNDPKGEKAMRVVKGIHGLHVYATEFWTEHLLQYASMNDLNWPERLVELADRLANKLEEHSSSSAEDKPCLDEVSMDTRLEFLKERPLLSKHVEASLKARTLKRLESNILQEAHGNSNEWSQDQFVTFDSSTAEYSQRSHCSLGTDSIAAMLSSYQETTTFLLQQDRFPGVSSTELELWKSQFRTSAFTCRLGFCPRATEGFLSEDLRRQHEMAHTQLTICTIPDCKYPPFPTVRALKSHMKRCHLYKPARRPIRLPVSLTGKNRESVKTKKPSETSSFGDHSIKSQEDGVVQKDSNTGKRKRALEKDHNQQQLAPSRKPDVTNKDSTTDGIAADESTSHVDESMGYRACAFHGCFERLNSNESSDTWMLHYWDCHHADCVARCADSRCGVVFANNQSLGTHYIQRHTAFFCNLCIDQDSEGYKLEQELSRHWLSAHMKKVKRWVCDDAHLASGMIPSMVIPFDSCPPCRGGQKYEQRHDAIGHLMDVHFQSDRDEPDFGARFLDALSLYIVEVWVYEVEAGTGPCEPVESGMRKRYKDNFDEEEESDEEGEPDSMFFVAELA